MPPNLEKPKEESYSLEPKLDFIDGGAEGLDHVRLSALIILSIPYPGPHSALGTANSNLHAIRRHFLRFFGQICRPIFPFFPIYATPRLLGPCLAIHVKMSEDSLELTSPLLTPTHVLLRCCL